LLLSWTALYFIAYSVLGVSRYFWYYAPLVPGYIALIGLGLEAIAHLVKTGSLKSLSQALSETQSENAPDPPAAQAQRSASRQRIALSLVGVLLVSLTVAQLVDVYKLSITPDSRAAAYRAVGEWLRDNTPPDSLVSSLEIGIIGYYADRRMVDFAGLLQPEVAQRLHNSPTYEDAAIWAATNYSPDYVVLVKGDLRALKQGYLDEYCRVEKHFQSNDYRYGAFINVYACP
jgi:hypothetical protein